MPKILDRGGIMNLRRVKLHGRGRFFTGSQRMKSFRPGRGEKKASDFSQAQNVVKTKHMGEESTPNGFYT